MTASAELVVWMLATIVGLIFGTAALIFSLRQRRSLRESGHTNLVPVQTSYVQLNAIVLTLLSLNLTAGLAGTVRAIATWAVISGAVILAFFSIWNFFWQTAGPRKGSPPTLPPGTAL